MSSFSHLSATSYNSNNGNPKKHWRGPALFDSAIWEAARRFAGITHRRIRRRRAPPGSWCCGRAQSPGPRDRSLETSVLGLRKSPSVHCSKPTAPLAYGCCRRKHGGGPILPAASQRAHVGELWRTGGYSGATRRPVIGRQFFLPICLNKAAHQSLLAQAGAHGATGATGTQGPQGAGAPVDPR